MCAESMQSAQSPFSCAGCRSFAGVRWCIPSCQNCFIKRTHWAHPSQVVISTLHRRARGRRNAADRRDPSLSCHIYCCYTQVIAPTCADAFPVVGGSARVKGSGAGPNRAVVKAALTCGFLTSIVVRVFGRFQKRKEFFGNHGGALSLHHRASSPSVPGISAPGNSARKSVTGALRFT